ncbi:FecR family protein [Novosphingobium pentaromativorans]|uniref:Anti-FecI sigma factor, FecR n=1 Tax=Novosphingobium pentaromativorans US6-1 TaxID=1088721 RepID=G6EGW2_9SPHN|nr:FecR domain-containing protein [Novosphingobium pentaromativorans]AIT82046.1 iron dicitrate transport regulator FecR [Novosphingobium pentaromativorans US6-1]EHJ59251.1 anti-FecI sigma factor, FecR [Novosphingobium pentaromativorans US6-1]
MAIDETIRQQALDWALRAGDPQFEEWEAFTSWLEADPAHGQAYDAVAAAVADAADLVAGAGPANDDDLGAVQSEEASLRSSRRRWLGGAIAASLALVGAFTLWQANSRDLYRIDVAPGAIRTVALDPGTRIDLGGDTAIELDRDDPRYARLEKGQALFTIRHDDAHPFRLKVGEDTLVDVGTVFDVRHRGEEMSVAVSEGAVQFNPDDQNQRVSPGQILRRNGQDGRITLEAIAPDRVGEWREGRLTFSDASLGQVAADLTSSTGIAFDAAPGASLVSVSGSLRLAPIRKDPRALGALLGLDVRREGDRWIIGER